MFKELKKCFSQLTKNSFIVVLGGLILAYVLYNYSSGKSFSFEGNQNDNRPIASPQQNGPSVDGGANNYQPAGPEGENSDYANAGGLNTDQYGLPPSCSKQSVVDPKELLPQDSNSEFSKLNPSGAGDLMNVSLLKAGHHIGINTVGQSLRNANLQLRSEPANPKMDVGPWNQTTIAGDPYRRPLEIGSN
jgi:hypothetical protein